MNVEYHHTGFLSYKSLSSRSWPLMQVRLQFLCNRGINWPELHINCVSDQIESDVSDQQRTVLMTCAPTENVLVVKRINKTDSETVIENGTIVRDQTVELEKIWVDDILIDSNLIMKLSVFVNDFSLEYIQYCKANNIEPAEIESHWPVWYFNGTWTWCFDIPFWKWYAAKRQEQQFLYHSDRNRELYIGTDANKHRELLDELKKLLSNHA